MVFRYINAKIVKEDLGIKEEGVMPISGMNMYFTNRPFEN